MKHYITFTLLLRPSHWPLWLLLLVAVVAGGCTQQSGGSSTTEPAEPETASTAEQSATPKPQPTKTATPKPTKTPVPQPTSLSTAELDEPFELAGGAETTVGSEGLLLHFESVLEDSRCPTQVECFWSGQARILITASQAGEETVKLEFNTNPAPDQTVDTLPAYNYSVQLLQLDPYPQTTNAIPFPDYQAQLLVVIQEP